MPRLVKDIFRHVKTHLQWLLPEIVFGWLAGIFLLSIFHLPKILWPLTDVLRVSEKRLWATFMLSAFVLTRLLCEWIEESHLCHRWTNNIRCKESFYCSWDHQAAMATGLLISFRHIVFNGLLQAWFLLSAVVVAALVSSVFWYDSKPLQEERVNEGSAFLPLDRISEDKLQRARFVEKLNDAIRNAWEDTTLSGAIIGLNGELGIGKTSVLNFLHERLRNTYGENGPIWVRIEPWPIRGAAAIQRHLLYQLEAALSERYNYTGFHSTLEDYLHFLESGWPDLKGFSAFRSFLGLGSQSLEQEVVKLNRILRRIDSKVLVVIDDLDRLLPPELYSLMRLVDHLRALPQTIFLLSYDPAVTPVNFSRASTITAAEIANG